MQEKNDVKEEVAVSDSAVLNGSFSSSSDDVLSPSVGIKRKYFYNFIKRVFDIVSSGLVLIVVSWLILLCMLIKWLEDAKNSAYELEIIERESADAPKPKKAKRYVRADGKVVDCILKPRKKERGEKIKKSPIYASTRVGKDGKEFKFYKIRSMCPGAECMKQALIDAGLNEADPPAFKMKDDPRITRFGRFLRKTSIDELPQLINIFIGKMSVVGPRPPLPKEVAEYTDYQKQRLAVKGGLLCLWQIQHDRNKLSFDDWVRLDLEYIQNRSLWLDFKIIVKGFFMVVFDRSGE